METVKPLEVNCYIDQVRVGSFTLDMVDLELLLYQVPLFYSNVGMPWQCLVITVQDDILLNLQLAVWPCWFLCSLGHGELILDSISYCEALAHP